MTDIHRLEARYSRYRSDSLLASINQVAANGGEISVDDETAGLLNYAAACYQQSDGLFDISSGILRRAWRFDSHQLPDQSHIESLMQKVGWHKLDWKPPLLKFPTPGMELDFGGIVKEYAADRAAGLCQDAGVQHGLVNLGGDIKIIGPRADGRPWRVGLGDPSQERGGHRLVPLRHGAIASSGDYERCMTIAGVRYSHILNPRTGWPVRHLAAVSVISEFCVVAGSASTIAMLKEADGPAWLAQLDLPYLWIDISGNCGGPLADPA